MAELASAPSIVEKIARSPRALSAREVAEFLRVSEMTIYRLARTGGIPSFKVGNSVRFDPNAVASWLRRRMYSRPST